MARDIFDGIDSPLTRRISAELHPKIQRLFDQINTATRIETLRVPPGNRLEKLQGNLKDYWSLRINKQWRILFRWEKDDALDIDIVDYH